MPLNPLRRSPIINRLNKQIPGFGLVGGVPVDDTDNETRGKGGRRDTQPLQSVRDTPGEEQPADGGEVLCESLRVKVIILHSCEDGEVVPLYGVRPILVQRLQLKATTKPRVTRRAQELREQGSSHLIQELFDWRKRTSGEHLLEREAQITRRDIHEGYAKKGAYPRQ